MIMSRKLQLVTVLLLTCICAPLLGAEPNKAKTELKFEMKSFQEVRMLLRAQHNPPYGTTHSAVLFVRGDWRYYRNSAPIESVLETSVGRAMSQQQRDVISNQSIKFRDYGATISNYTYFQLFGISEEDVKKMVNAFIKVATNRADEEMQFVLKEQQERKEKIADIKKELPEKQKQLKAAESKYKEIKNARYFPHNSSETYKKARETMFQMDKMLDVLEIELAGILEKVKSIEKYRQRKYAEDAKKFSRETLDKLDQMYVEQMIELSSAKARQNAALQIREREKEFLNLFSQWSNLEGEVNVLKGRLADQEHNLRQAETKLANPVPEMLPPKLYQDKVTIYPVK